MLCENCLCNCLVNPWRALSSGHTCQSIPANKNYGATTTRTECSAVMWQLLVLLLHLVNHWCIIFFLSMLSIFLPTKIMVQKQLVCYHVRVVTGASSSDACWFYSYQPNNKWNTTTNWADVWVFSVQLLGKSLSTSSSSGCMHADYIPANQWNNKVINN